MTSPPCPWKDCNICPDSTSHRPQVESPLPVRIWKAGDKHNLSHSHHTAIQTSGGPRIGLDPWLVCQLRFRLSLQLSGVSGGPGGGSWVYQHSRWLETKPRLRLVYFDLTLRVFSDFSGFPLSPQKEIFTPNSVLLSTLTMSLWLGRLGNDSYHNVRYKS